MIKQSPFLALLILVSGYVLWSIAFIALYAGHALSCASEGVRGPAPWWVVASAWAIHIALHAGLAGWIWRRFPRPPNGHTAFLRTGALALAGTALVATIVTGLPVLLVLPCR